MMAVSVNRNIWALGPSGGHGSLKRFGPRRLGVGLLFTALLEGLRSFLKGPIQAYVRKHIGLGQGSVTD